MEGRRGSPHPTVRAHLRFNRKRPLDVPLDESATLDIVAIRAVESAARGKDFWTDADRAWASRVASETVGEGGAPEIFLATRARLALERIGERHRALPRAVRALHWRPWVGVAIVALAFGAGVAGDQVGGSQRINLLAPPLFALLAWNLVVYALLAIGFVVRYGDAASLGPLRGFVARLAGGSARHVRGELAEAVAQFAYEWTRLTAPLYAARSARVLHLAAAALAVGLVAGLYLRGIALEYRAAWESTFLGAESVRSVLAAALSPGAAITGIPVPSAAEVAAVRAPSGENAARWLHLMAATVALVVIVPRLALALAMGLVERHRSRHLPLVLDGPYFARLLRAYRGGAARVEVVPYSYTMRPAEADGLERLMRRVFGANASLSVRAPVRYGDEDAVAATGEEARAASVIALFNATATPEREAHGAFLDALAGQLGSGGILVALVADDAFRERSGNEPMRLEERRLAWRALCSDRRVACVMATLAAPDQGEAAAEIERLLEGAAP
jgi:hypothetical protein